MALQRPAPVSGLPIWHIVVLSLPLGFSLNFFGAPLPWQDGLLSLVVGDGHASRLQRFGASMLSQVLLPWVCAFAALSVLRARRWLILTRLGLIASVFVSATISCLAAVGAYRAAQDLSPYLGNDVAAAARVILVTAVALGLGTTCLWTVWRALPTSWKPHLRAGWAYLNHAHPAPDFGPLQLQQPNARSTQD
jgi:hypothetical protein